MDQRAKMELQDYCDMIRMNADSIRQELMGIKGPVRRKLEKSIFAIQVWLGGIDANVANIISLADQEEVRDCDHWMLAQFRLGDNGQQVTSADRNLLDAFARTAEDGGARG